MRICLFWVALLAALPAAALAQPRAAAVGTTRPDLVLSEPAERPSEYLHIARSALVLNRTREAQEALEMAQTRLLDRSVPIGQTSNPSGNVTSEQIFQARQALATHDRATCMSLIEAAITSAAAQGF